VLCHEGESRSLIYIEFIMDSNEYHSHIVRFASPVFTIVDISNPSWSSEQSIDSMEHSGWAAARGSRDESVEPLDFGLGSLPSYQDSEHFLIDVEGSEPLNFGLGSIPAIHYKGEYFTVDNNETEYDFGLPLNGERVDNVVTEYDLGLPLNGERVDNDVAEYDFGLPLNGERVDNDVTEYDFGLPLNGERVNEMYDQELLDFGIPQSPPHVKSRIAPGHDDHTSVSADKKYQNPMRMHVLPTSSPHRPLHDNSSHALPSGLEDHHKPLSDGELLKMCHSMRLGVLSEDEFKYARQLLTEVADRDNGHDIASPTLQDIIEAERPLHVAYTQATTTLRKRVQDLQGAIRLHNHTQQLRDQVQAMLDSVERRESLFK